MIYDTVIIGSGLGGLSAGIYLQKQKPQTLILEKNPVPGGACQTIKVDEYEFDLTLHHFIPTRSKFDIHSSTQSLFKDLSLTELPWIQAQSLAMVAWPGQAPVYLTTNLKQLQEQIKQLVPEDFSRVSDWVVQLLKTSPQFKVKTAQQIFIENKIPFSVQKFLGAYWPYLGVPLSKLSGDYYFGLLRALLSGKALSLSSSKSLLNSLITEYQKSNGEIQYNTRVSRLNYSSGLWHITTADKSFQALNLVCNISPEIFFKILSFSKSTFSQETFNVLSTLKNLTSQRKPAIQIWSLFLVLDCPQTTFNLDKASEQILYWSDNLDLSPLFVLNNSYLTPEEPITRLNLSICFTEEQISEFFSIDPYNDQAGVIQQFLKVYQRITGYDLTKYIKAQVLLTPVEYADYFGTSNGTGYGYALEGWDQAALRIFTWKSETTIPHLAFCGGYCQAGNGYSHSLLSGQTAANHILSTDNNFKELKIKELQALSELSDPEAFQLYKTRIQQTKLYSSEKLDTFVRDLAVERYQSTGQVNPIFRNKL